LKKEVLFSLTILGSSSALPTSKRFPSAHLLTVNERFFLIDCGEGTQIQLRKFKLRFGKLNHIFISHIHGDHIFGLFGLLSSFQLLGRGNDLHIYAPGELKEIIDFYLKIFSYENKFRIIIHPLGYKRKKLIYKDEWIEVFSIPLNHRIPTCGFLFREVPQ
jgi:ribonuclease Z